MLFLGPYLNPRVCLVSYFVQSAVSRSVCAVLFTPANTYINLSFRILTLQSTSIFPTVPILVYLTMVHTVVDRALRYLDDNERQRLRDQTKEPVSWDTGAVYGHPRGDVNDYQVFRSDQLTMYQPVEKAEATEVLAKFLTPTEPLPPDQTSALSRLKAAANNPQWDPSLVIKALADLDIAFFNGRLERHVIAAWATETEMVEKGNGGRKPKHCATGLCQLLDPEKNEGKQRCKVWLNSDAIFDMPDPRRVMWETLFHELVVSASRPTLE